MTVCLATSTTLAKHIEWKAEIFRPVMLLKGSGTIDAKLGIAVESCPRSTASYSTIHWSVHINNDMGASPSSQCGLRRVA